MGIGKYVGLAVNELFGCLEARSFENQEAHRLVLENKYESDKTDIAWLRSPFLNDSQLNSLLSQKESETKITGHLSVTQYT